jgi:hypothetical protein
MTAMVILFLAIMLLLPAYSLAKTNIDVVKEKLAQRRGLHLDSSMSYGQVIFYDDLPSWSDLSSVEQRLFTSRKVEPWYSLSDEDKSRRFYSSDWKTLEEPWIELVLTWANLSNNAYGSIPETLGPELIGDLFDICRAHVQISSDARSAIHEGERWIKNSLKSPLTGLYPKLTATEFSPGALYIHPLSSEEKVHFAQLLGITEAQAQAPKSIALYFRLYGEHNIIAQGIRWFGTD